MRAAIFSLVALAFVVMAVDAIPDKDGEILQK